MQEELVRNQLARILASPCFEAAERNRKFLSFVVEQTIEGRAERIKAYTIATEVFGRGKDFDPQLDSIVRIEAGRLRRSIEHYYLTAGIGDPVRITIPKGSYVPVFSPSGNNGEAASGLVASERHREGSRTVLVEAFEHGSGNEQETQFARAIERQIILGLTRFANLSVYAGGDWHGTTQAARECASKAEFILRGSASISGHMLRVDAFLLHARTGQYVWASQYDRELSEEPVRVSDEVANRIVRALAQPHGAIFKNKAEGEAAQAEPGTQDSIAQFHRYSRTYGKKPFQEVFHALKETVGREPQNAEALACLARVYIDSARFRWELPGESSDQLARARSLAQEAVEISPDSSSCHHALAMAYWFLGNVDSSFSAFHAGIELNPNDTEIMVDLGFRYAMLADWEKAIPLLETAFDQDPYLPGTYRIALSLYHFWHGRYAESLIEARRVVSPDVLYGHVMRAICATNLGHESERREAVEAILAIDPHYGDKVSADLEARNVHPKLIRLIATGLAKAGLRVSLSRLGTANQEVEVVAVSAAPSLRGRRG